MEIYKHIMNNTVSLYQIFFNLYICAEFLRKYNEKQTCRHSKVFLKSVKDRIHTKNSIVTYSSVDQMLFQSSALSFFM